MSNLVAIVYPDEQTAVQVVNKLRELTALYLIELEDVVYVTKDAKGKPQLHQSVNLTASGATYGAFWGMLIGLIFFIPVFGLAFGAIMGALGGKMSDYGIDDKFIKGVSASLEPGKAAVFALVRKSTPEKVLPELAPFGGQVFHTNLSPEVEAKLQEALSHPETVAAAAPAVEAPAAAAPAADAPAATTTE
jgi:uncharacterized membrane protein